jgi:hypothetical protein
VAHRQHRWLPHAPQMVELFGQVRPPMPGYVVLTREDIDHVAGNQLDGMYHLAKAKGLALEF